VLSNSITKSVPKVTKKVLEIVYLICEAALPNAAFLTHAITAADAALRHKDRTEPKYIPLQGYCHNTHPILSVSDEAVGS